MIHKNRFSKKSSKNLYPLSKPPPKFGKFLVIWELRQRVLRYNIIKTSIIFNHFYSFLIYIIDFTNFFKNKLISYMLVYL